MRALTRVLCATLALLALASCGQGVASLRLGQTFALAPDLSVKLLASRPTVSQLRLDLTVLPTGSTPLSALVPSVVVIPGGGREISATLNFQRDRALIMMLLDGAQHVTSVTVRDARSGRSADWSVVADQSLLNCKPGDTCQIIGIPQAPSFPGRP